MTKLRAKRTKLQTFDREEVSDGAESEKDKVRDNDLGKRDKDKFYSKTK